MIKAVIIVDEQHSTNRLTELLEKYCKQSIQLAGNFNTVEDGVKAIKSLRPELVLLDVQIHNKTGFDLLQQLPGE